MIKLSNKSELFSFILRKGIMVKKNVILILKNYVLKFIKVQTLNCLVNYKVKYTEVINIKVSKNVYYS